MSSFQHRFNDLCKTYLSALNKSDLPKVISLFSPQGRVVSPLYGELAAEDFYRKLFEDTNESVVELKDILCNSDKHSGALYFTYHWTLATGHLVHFDVIDYIQLNEQDQIESLRIIYDTKQTRQEWDRL